MGAGVDDGEFGVVFEGGLAGGDEHAEARAVDKADIRDVELDARGTRRGKRFAKLHRELHRIGAADEIAGESDNESIRDVLESGIHGPKAREDGHMTVLSLTPGTVAKLPRNFVDQAVAISLRGPRVRAAGFVVAASLPPRCSQS